MTTDGFNPAEFCQSMIEKGESLASQYLFYAFGDMAYAIPDPEKVRLIGQFLDVEHEAAMQNGGQFSDGSRKRV